MTSTPHTFHIHVRMQCIHKERSKGVSDDDLHYTWNSEGFLCKKRKLKYLCHFCSR